MHNWITNGARSTPTTCLSTDNCSHGCGYFCGKFMPRLVFWGIQIFLTVLIFRKLWTRSFELLMLQNELWTPHTPMYTLTFGTNRHNTKRKTSQLMERVAIKTQREGGQKLQKPGWRRSKRTTVSNKLDFSKMWLWHHAASLAGLCWFVKTCVFWRPRSICFMSLCRLPMGSYRFVSCPFAGFAWDEASELVNNMMWVRNTLAHPLNHTQDFDRSQQGEFRQALQTLQNEKFLHQGECRALQSFVDRAHCVTRKDQGEPFKASCERNQRSVDPFTGTDRTQQPKKRGYKGDRKWVLHLFQCGNSASEASQMNDVWKWNEPIGFSILNKVEKLCPSWLDFCQSCEQRHGTEAKRRWAEHFGVMSNFWTNLWMSCWTFENWFQQWIIFFSSFDLFEEIDQKFCGTELPSKDKDTFQFSFPPPSKLIESQEFLNISQNSLNNRISFTSKWKVPLILTSSAITVGPHVKVKNLMPVTSVEFVDRNSPSMK